MQDLHKNNPLLREVFHSKVHDVKFYAPAEDGKYHTSRYIAAGHQNIYSASGVTKDFIDNWSEKFLDIVNSENNKDRLRTDAAVMLNNLRYRLKYPVDEDCGLRMGAIYAIAQDEPFEMLENLHTDRKVKLARGSASEKIAPDPELYTFFLTLGIEFTASWQEYKADIIGTPYFQKRMETLNSLTPLKA